MVKSFSQFCPDFHEWPERWMGLDEDIPAGENINEIFKLFIEYLIESNYAEKTIRQHIDNLWLLGGEIIREVNMDKKLRNSSGFDLVMNNIYSEGGQSCRHIDTEEEERSFDSTCKKLYKFLNQRK